MWWGLNRFHLVLLSLPISSIYSIADSIFLAWSCLSFQYFSFNISLLKICLYSSYCIFGVILDSISFSNHYILSKSSFFLSARVQCRKSRHISYSSFWLTPHQFSYLSSETTKEESLKAGLLIHLLISWESIDFVILLFSSNAFLLVTLLAKSLLKYLLWSLVINLLGVILDSIKLF